MMCLIFLAYCFGPGNFWPLMALVFCHIILMTFVHAMIVRRKRNIDISLLFTYFFNGLANLYVHNWINHSKHYNDKERMSSLFLRIFVVEMIIIVENVIALLATIIIHHDNELHIYFCVGAVCVHFAGLILKFLHYKFCHIWRDLIAEDFKKFKCSMRTTKLQNCKK